MSKIRIWCYSDAVFNKIRTMWIKENRIKRTMLKNFVRAEPFDINGFKGFDIVIITKLIKPSHLFNQIDADLKDEGYTSKDYKIKVVENE